MNREVKFPFFYIQGDGSLRLSTSVDTSVDIPDACPMCKAYGLNPILSSYAIERPDDGDFDLVATMFCVACRKPFMVSYHSGDMEPYSVEPSSVPSRTFEPSLTNLTPQFVDAYNQALAAESYGLTDIAGMGYRKSLEYLIKDYLIYRSPENAEAIKQEALGSCIGNKVDNTRLKATARSATWLGNDFTHYERRYNEFDINALKRYIDATIHWILMELTTDEAETVDRR